MTKKKIIRTGCCCAGAPDGLSMAVGIHIIRAGEDIRAAMSAADKEMYEEKRAYYARHPDRRSR